MSIPFKDQPAFPVTLDSDGKLTAESPGLTKGEYIAIEMMKGVLMRGSTADPQVNIREAMHYTWQLIAELEKP